MIAALQGNRLIGWYCFLIHGQSSGVPAHAGDPDVFWHIRLELLPHSDHEALVAPCRRTEK
jgi:hypothetical protein